jgi:hypothetical protein
MEHTENPAGEVRDVFHPFRLLSGQEGEMPNLEADKASPEAGLDEYGSPRATP